jgi:hypothetical protein
MYVIAKAIDFLVAKAMAHTGGFMLTQRAPVHFDPDIN